MRRGLVIPALLAAALAGGGVASAQSKDEKSAHVRRDPAGKTGISPYMETIVKGEKQFTGGDAASAIATFQDATRQDPAGMLAFYRLGEAQVAAGKLDDADASFKAALGKKNDDAPSTDKKSVEKPVAQKGDDNLHAKVLFVIADLRERQGKWQDAKDAWGAYAAFLQNNPKAHGYPATATERQKMADRRMNDEVVYGKVKDRIVARKAQLEKEATENAQKDKLNR